MDIAASGVPPMDGSLRVYRQVLGLRLVPAKQRCLVSSTVLRRGITRPVGDMFPDNQLAIVRSTKQIMVPNH